MANRTMLVSVVLSAYSANLRRGSLNATGDWKHCACAGTRARFRFPELFARPTEDDASSWSQSRMPNSCTRTATSSGSGKNSAGGAPDADEEDELDDQDMKRHGWLNVIKKNFPRASTAA